MDIYALEQIEQEARSLQKLEIHAGRTGNEELRYSWSRVCGIEVRRVTGGPDLCLLLPTEPTEWRHFVAGDDGAEKEERMETLLTRLGEQVPGSSTNLSRDRALEELRANNFAPEVGHTIEALHVDSDPSSLPVPRIVIHRKTGRIEVTKGRKFPHSDPIAALADLCSILQRQILPDGAHPAQGPIADTLASMGSQARSDADGRQPKSGKQIEDAQAIEVTVTTAPTEEADHGENHSVDTVSESPAAEVSAASTEQLRVERDDRFSDAVARWRPKAHRDIPFAWIYEKADVHRGEAYQWKNGQLPDSSVMSMRIEAVLKRAEPPSNPNPSEDAMGENSY